MKSPNNRSSEFVRARTLVRNTLIYNMAKDLGFSDIQIAHAHLKGDTAGTIIVPGLARSPEQLKDMASEYICRFRGADSGPLIRRNIVKKGYDKNTPIELSDVRRIIAEHEKLTDKEKTTKPTLKERSLFDIRSLDANIADQIIELKSELQSLKACVQGQATEPESVRTATPQQILSEDRRMTSISIPRELQAALRQLTLQAGADRNHRVATWELIAEALLGNDQAQDLKMRFKELAG